MRNGIRSIRRIKIDMMRETILEITGRFQLSGNDAKLRPLKKVFGPTFTIKEKIGTLEVTAYFKTLSILLNLLINNIELLEKNKIDTIAINLDILYKNQCNWEATIEEVRKLSFLNATLNISVNRISL